MAGKRNSVLDWASTFLNGLTGRDSEVAEGVRRKTVRDYGSESRSEGRKDEDKRPQDSEEEQKRKERLLGEWARYAK